MAGFAKPDYGHLPIDPFMKRLFGLSLWWPVAARDEEGSKLILYGVGLRPMRASFLRYGVHSSSAGRLDLFLRLRSRCILLWPWRRRCGGFRVDGLFSVLSRHESSGKFLGFFCSPLLSLSPSPSIPFRKSEAVRAHAYHAYRAYGIANIVGYSW